jgi:hypothetical protein
MLKLKYKLNFKRNLFLEKEMKIVFQKAIFKCLNNRFRSNNKFFLLRDVNNINLSTIFLHFEHLNELLGL